MPSSSTAARRAARSTTTSRAAASNCCARPPTTPASTWRGDSNEPRPTTRSRALDSLLDEYRATSMATDFRAGCPVVAVAVESAEDGPDLRDDVVGAFDRWRRTHRARRSSRAGIDAARADELAMLVDRRLRGRADPQPGLPRPRAAGEPAARDAPAGRRGVRDVEAHERRRRDLGPDRLHPLRVQLRDRGPARRPHPRSHPRRQGAPGVAGLHLQQGDAARPLPERSATA